MATDPKRREPSLEIRRQIDDSIADRTAQSGALTSSSSTDGKDLRSVINCAEPGIPPVGSQFEYLDHPADVILHSWGSNLSDALSNLGLCMFGYITSLDSVSIDEAQSSDNGNNLIAQGHDLHSLIYSYLDEWLFNFHDTGFIPKEIDVSELSRDVWRIASSGRGEILDIKRHPQGTEVKAITYNGMEVEEKNGRCDVYVVVDI